ncbi:hypothetical protein FRC10_010067 [Ceratobasidium sp. 414]|nr:hypothetical protein FRC10_010067 [Ceratobasidium sp. 414]
MSLASFYTGLPRRVRIFVNTGGALILLVSVSYFAQPGPAYWSRTPNAYLPSYLQDEYRAYGPEPLRIANRSARGVECQWADVVEESVKMIAHVPRVPEFPILSAWLKPEAARYGPALKAIPETLRDQFMLGGSVRMYEDFYDQAYLGGKAMESTWSIEEVNTYRQHARNRNPHLTYKNAPLYEAFDRWGSLAIRGQRGLVIGSETPWLEAMLLEYGASHVSTLEFGSITTTHPQLSTFTPQQFTLAFLQGKIEPFDFAVSYSSLEHDGLGRYGDTLNPIGDLQTMAKMLSAVRPGGFFFLGTPCCEDALYWNAHRVYGPVRYSKMFAGWRVLGSAPLNAMAGGEGRPGNWVFQPMWALQNTVGCKGGPDVVDVRELGKSLP